MTQNQRWQPLAMRESILVAFYDLFEKPHYIIKKPLYFFPNGFHPFHFLAPSFDFAMLIALYAIIIILNASFVKRFFAKIY